MGEVYAKNFAKFSGGSSVHVCPLPGPYPGLPHPPLRMLTILELMISTLTISILAKPPS